MHCRCLALLPLSRWKQHQGRRGRGHSRVARRSALRDLFPKASSELGKLPISCRAPSVVLTAHASLLGVLNLQQACYSLWFSSLSAAAGFCRSLMYAPAALPPSPRGDLVADVVTSLTPQSVVAWEDTAESIRLQESEERERERCEHPRRCRSETTTATRRSLRRRASSPRRGSSLLPLLLLAPPCAALVGSLLLALLAESEAVARRRRRRPELGLGVGVMMHVAALGAAGGIAACLVDGGTRIPDAAHCARRRGAREEGQQPGPHMVVVVLGPLSARASWASARAALGTALARLSRYELEK